MPNGFNNRPSIGQSLLDNVAGNISGVFSTRPSAKYSSGARTILKVNGKIVGFAFGISWRISTQVTEINTIDDPLPNEFTPQRLSVEGTISMLHIPGTSAGSELWQAGIQTFLFAPYISIEVRDSATDQTLFFTTRAVITSRQEDIRVDQLSNATLTFKAIGFRDEVMSERPSDINSSSKSDKTPADSTPGLNSPPGTRIDTNTVIPKTTSLV